MAPPTYNVPLPWPTASAGQGYDATANNYGISSQADLLQVMAALYGTPTSQAPKGMSVNLNPQGVPTSLRQPSYWDQLAAQYGPGTRPLDGPPPAAPTPTVVRPTAPASTAPSPAQQALAQIWNRNGVTLPPGTYPNTPVTGQPGTGQTPMSTEFPMPAQSIPPGGRSFSDVLAAMSPGNILHKPVTQADATTRNNPVTGDAPASTAGKAKGKTTAEDMQLGGYGDDPYAVGRAGATPTGVDVTGLGEAVKQQMAAEQAVHDEQAKQQAPKATDPYSMDSADIMARLAKAEKGSREAGLWDGLAQMGAALAASKNSHFGQAMGEAMMTGLGAWQNASDKAFEKAVTKESLGIEGQKVIAARLQAAAAMTTPEMKNFQFNVEKLGVDPTTAMYGSKLLTNPADALTNSGMTAMVQTGLMGGDTGKDTKVLSDAVGAGLAVQRENRYNIGTSANPGATVGNPYATSVLRPLALGATAPRAIWHADPNSSLGYSIRR